MIIIKRCVEISSKKLSSVYMSHFQIWLFFTILVTILVTKFSIRIGPLLIFKLCYQIVLACYLCLNGR